MSVADLCEKNTRWRIVVRARHNGAEVGNAPCPRFQDQEQLGVSLARRSNAVSRSASVPAIFLGCQTKKAGAWPASTTCFSAGSQLTLISRAVPWFEAHWSLEICVRRRRLSFGLLALTVLNLLCAPLIRRLASSRLFSVYCRFVTNSVVLERPPGRHAANCNLINKLDAGNAITFRKEL